MSKNKNADNEMEPIVESVESADESATVRVVNPEIKKEKEPESSFCIYIGPTIRGVVQKGTIYSGSRKSVLEELSSAIDKYPGIAKLIVSGEKAAEEMHNVETSGTLLNKIYKKVARGKN